MTGARSQTAALFALALGTGCASGGPGGNSGGEAACAAPMTSVAESTVTPGQTVRVSAEGLWSSCRDHGTVDEDGTVHYPDPEPTPLTEQVVTFGQGGAEVELAVVDAGPAAAVEVDVTIPADAEPGEAELAVGRAEPAAVTVVTEAGSPRTSP